jgi:hypothetical protein
MHLGMPTGSNTFASTGRLGARCYIATGQRLFFASASAEITFITGKLVEL